jgi:hypothetical protein
VEDPRYAGAMTKAFDVMTLRHSFNIVTDVGPTRDSHTRNFSSLFRELAIFHHRLSCILSSEGGLVAVQAPAAVPVVYAQVQIRQGLTKALVERIVVTTKRTTIHM